MISRYVLGARSLLIAACLVCIASTEADVHTFDASKPFSVVFDSDGTLFGVEFGEGNALFTIEDDAKLFFIAGRPGPEGLPTATGYVGDGGTRDARFKGMHDLAISPDGNTIYIADTFNNRVRVFNRKEVTISTLVGGSDFGFADGPLASAKINQPFTVDISNDGRRLLIADLKNLRIREVDLGARRIRTVAGTGRKGRAQEGGLATESTLISPRAAIYGRDGLIYFASREGNAVRRINADGRIETLVNRSGKMGYAGDGGPGLDARLSGPKHLSLDPDGNIVIADDQNHCVRLLDLSDGSIRLLAGVPNESSRHIGDGPLDTHLQRPHGARYDREGRLWVCDSWNDRLICFD